MTATQLDLADLLDAVALNPQPLAVEYRQRITAALIAAAETHPDGLVDPNAVRAMLSNAHGLTVPPRQLSATYSALASQGVLEHAGWTTSDDVRGGNAGKPQRLWRWVGGA